LNIRNGTIFVNENIWLGRKIFGDKHFGFIALAIYTFIRFRFNDEFFLDFTVNFWYDEIGWFGSGFSVV